MEITDTDLSKAYTIFDRMKVGEEYPLSKVPEERREVFRECVKHRVRYSGDLEASGDWQRIRKIENYFI